MGRSFVFVARVLAQPPGRTHRMEIQTVYGRVVNDHQITTIEIVGREVVPAVAKNWFSH